MEKRVRKPGTAFRATVAFLILNLPLIVTAYFTYLMSGGEAAESYVRGILAVSIAVAEFSIVVTTIGPPMAEWIKSEKPGTAIRATIAFLILNLPLIIAAYFTYWISGGAAAEWYVRGIVAVGVTVAEFAIVVNTIGPPMAEWIRSEEVIKDNEKPSWERK